MITIYSDDVLMLQAQQKKCDKCFNYILVSRFIFENNHLPKFILIFSWLDYELYSKPVPRYPTCATQVVRHKVKTA